MPRLSIDPSKARASDKVVHLLPSSIPSSWVMAHGVASRRYQYDIIFVDRVQFRSL